MKVKINSVTALVFTGLFSYFGFLMRFDPDVHHDGIMFTPAIAFSEGLLPNRDAFAYYGPGSPIIQGLAIRVLGANLYSIRLLGAAVFALSFTLVFYLLLRRFSINWAITFTLLGAIPAASILPWSTAFTTLANLICLTMLFRSTKKESARFLNPLVIAASFLIGLSFYVRIHQIFISFTVLFFLIFIRKNRSHSFSWIIGFVLSHALVVILMSLNGMLADFILDCIVYPQSVAIIKTFEISYFVGLLWYPLLTVITVAYVFFVKQIYQKNIVRISAITTIAVVLGYLSYRVSLWSRTGWVTYRNPKIVAIDGSWLSNVLIGYLSATVVLILSIKIIYDRKFRNNQEISLGICVALGVLPQLYPMYDRMHLWLIMPVLMLPSLFYLSTSKYWIPNVQIATRFAVISLAILQVLTIGSFVAVKRDIFQSPSLVHMLATTESIKRIDPTIEMLSDFKNEKLSFNCNNAFYAAANQKFQSFSKYYVNWGKIGGVKSELGSKYTFICNLSKSDFVKYQHMGQVIQYRELEYDEAEGKVQRYNIISSDKK